jgi:hypothetical protein
MSARLLPLPVGGEGVCPVRIGGGEREVYAIPPGCCTMRLETAGLGPRYPVTGGVGVGTGAGPGLDTGLVVGLVVRPPWRIACLLFWNLREFNGIRDNNQGVDKRDRPTKFAHSAQTYPTALLGLHALPWMGMRYDYTWH